MRPRIAFAVLLGIGAGMHIFLITANPRSLMPLAMYSGWLILSGAVAGTFWVRNQQTAVWQAKRWTLRGKMAPRPSVEGLGWFALTATVGLVMHLLNAFIASGKYTQQQGMWLVFFLLAASCSGQLRGPVGDSDAPIPDGSTVSRVASGARRLAGLMIGCFGAWLFYFGTTASATYSDNYSLVISWFFKASGVILILIGLAFALLPDRDDASQETPSK